MWCHLRVMRTNAIRNVQSSSLCYQCSSTLHYIWSKYQINRPMVPGSQWLLVIGLLFISYWLLFILIKVVVYPTKSFAHIIHHTLWQPRPGEEIKKKRGLVKAITIGDVIITPDATTAAEEPNSKRPKMDPKDVVKLGPEAALRGMSGKDDQDTDGNAAGKSKDSKLRPNKKAKHLLKWGWRVWPLLLLMQGTTNETNINFITSSFIISSLSLTLLHCPNPDWIVLLTGYCCSSGNVNTNTNANAPMHCIEWLESTILLVSALNYQL